MASTKPSAHFQCGLDQAQDAPKDGRGQLRGVFFFFQFNKLLLGHFLFSSWRRGADSTNRRAHGHVSIPSANSSSVSMRVWISAMRR